MLNYTDKEYEDFKFRWAIAAFKRAYYRAKRDKLPFSIDILEIPTPDMCPVMNTALCYVPWSKRQHEKLPMLNSPALCRVKHDGGYTRGNIFTASRYANSAQASMDFEEAFGKLGIIMPHYPPP